MEENYKEGSINLMKLTTQSKSPSKNSNKFKVNFTFKANSKEYSSDNEQNKGATSPKRIILSRKDINSKNNQENQENEKKENSIEDKNNKKSTNSVGVFTPTPIDKKYSKNYEIQKNQKCKKLFNFN